MLADWKPQTGILYSLTKVIIKCPKNKWEKRKEEKKPILHHIKW